MKVSDIVTVVAASGEYVGRLLKMDETGVILENPKMVTITEDGQMGFTQGIAATGVDAPSEMVILQAIFVAETAAEVIKAWHSATSGLVMPQFVRSRGGMVYTTDLKSVAARLVGSSPIASTKIKSSVPLVKQLNGWCPECPEQDLKLLHQFV